jgi:succinate dehydrogenase/fumarate reductase flavoprotein subunit
MKKNIIETDVLIVGGGMAGLFAAIKAGEAGADITLADKGYIGNSGAYFTEGDILYFRSSEGDDLDKWINFITERSEYLNNRDWDEICLTESEARYNDLVSWGVKFIEDENGRVKVTKLGEFGAQIVMMENRKFTPTMRKKAEESGVRLLDRIMVCELVKKNGAIIGAVGFDTVSGEIYDIRTNAVIIASGVAYLQSGSSNMNFNTGDGEIMAYNAGAEIANKEIVSAFLPRRDSFESLNDPEKNIPIDKDKIKSAFSKYPFVGLQAAVPFADINAEGNRVALSAWDVHCGKGPIYSNAEAFTMPFKAFIAEFYTRVGRAELDKIGLDLLEGGLIELPASRPIGGATPVFAGSGIWISGKDCAVAGVPGLFVAGNSCASMASGAAYGGMGFGLNHAMVTGNRAAIGAVKYARKVIGTETSDECFSNARESMIAPLQRKGGFSARWFLQTLQGIVVPYYVMLVKDGTRLEAALTLVGFLNSHIAPKLVANDPHDLRKAIEARNLGLIVEMQLRSSLFRTESRGGHIREDYPGRRDPEWLAWVKLKNENGTMSVSKEPIPKKWWPDLSKSNNDRYPGMHPMELHTNA